MKIKGKPVVDANADLLLEINTDDCKGARKDPTQCAAARALLRSYSILSVKVHVTRTYLEEKTRWIRYITPDPLRTELIAFDRGGEMQTGLYRIQPPAPAQTLHYLSKRKLDPFRRSNYKNSKRRKQHTAENVRPHGPKPRGMMK
jgi:hypothetical protein